MSTYRDLDLAFTLHPSGDVAIKKDVSAISQSIKNLVLSYFEEFLNQPEIGSTVHGTLFKNNTAMLKFEIKKSIEEVLNNFEPRVDIIDVKIRDANNDSVLFIDIVYLVLNFPDPITDTVRLSRFR